MHLNPVLAELGATPITELHQQVRTRRDAGQRLIDFSIGDPREPTPSFVREELRAAVPEVSQYPTTTGLAELRGAIAGYFARRFGVEVDPATQIIPTSGAKEAIFSTPLAFIDRASSRRTVVYGTPGYPIYERGARFAGGDLYGVTLGGDFRLRASDIPDEVWDRAALVWVCSPHNPSGAVSDPNELRELLARCRDAGALLLSDECYADIYDENVYPGGPESVLSLAGDDCTGALSYVSCSKRSGMTGYRSAAIVGDAAAIAALKQLRTATGTASPEFVQSAAAAAWRDDAHAGERRAIFSEKRSILRKAFDGMGYETVASDAGLYLWVLVEDDLEITDRLLDHGVVVAPGRFFGPGGEGYIRLALVPAVEDCEAATEVLRACLT